MSNLVEGALARLRLRGSRGNQYEILATVTRAQATHLSLRLDNGRSLTVPVANVVDYILEPVEGDREAARPRQQPRGPSFLEAMASLANDVEVLEPVVSRGSDGHKGPVAEGELSLVTRIHRLQLSLEKFEQATTSTRYRSCARDLQKMSWKALTRIEQVDFQQSLLERTSYEELRKRTKRALDALSGSTRPVKILKSCYRVVVTNELDDWNRLYNRMKAEPRLVTEKSLILSVDRAGEAILPIKVKLDDAFVPARGIRVVLDQHRGVETVGVLPSIEQLEPGQVRTVRVRLKDRRRQGSKSEVRIVAHVEYLGPAGEQHRSAHQKITVALTRQSDFEPIPNPFRDYASGAPIDDPDMFFGRTELVQDICSQLLDRPIGRCYALFGQKRSGKSSVVNRVYDELRRSEALVARLSMGIVDRSQISASFVSEVVDQLREQVAETLDERTFQNLLTRWPDASAISSQPMASLRRAITAARALLRSTGRADPPRFVIVVDEFSYLFELLRRDNVAPSDQHQLRDFMRQWKGLLEAKVFSAFIVGQDTMPSFIAAFPNEFSVMHSERLDYLTSDEVEQLADMPIRRSDGSSRFSGFGLSSIFSYTSGHPYFTQIVCDRIVEFCNESRREVIAESDVDAAIETLMGGPRQIGAFRFDCLLSADNTGALSTATGGQGGDWVEIDAQDVAMRVVDRLARISGPQNKLVEVDHLSLNAAEKIVLLDLVDRGVLTLKEGRVNLRILLFAEYLRRGQI